MCVQLTAKSASARMGFTLLKRLPHLHILVLLLLVELSEQQQNEIQDLKYIILGRLDLMDNKLNHMDMQLNQMNEINDKVNNLDNKVDNMDRNMYREIMYIKGQVDLIESGLNTIGDRSSSELRELKAPVGEIKQQGISILEQIHLFKQEGNLFNNTINQLTVTSYNMAKKLDTVDHQLNTTLDNINKGKIEMATQINIIEKQLNQSITSLEDSFSIIDNSNMTNDDIFTKLESINDQLNQSVTSLQDSFSVINNSNMTNDDIFTKLESFNDQLDESVSSLKDSFSEIDNSTMTRDDIFTKLDSLNDQSDESISSLKDSFSEMDNSTMTRYDIFTKLEGIKDHFNGSITSLQGTIDTIDSQIRSLDKALAECREGFFRSNGSRKCFKVFIDIRRNWNEAKEKCKEERLKLAMPSISVAVALRKDITETYEGHPDVIRVWLDGRADGTTFRWQEDLSELSVNSPLWYPDQPGNAVTTDQCLRMLVESGNMRSHPNHPYHPAPCTTMYHTLCQEKD